MWQSPEKDKYNIAKLKCMGRGGIWIKRFYDESVLVIWTSFHLTCTVTLLLNFMLEMHTLFNIVIVFVAMMEN